MSKSGRLVFKKRRKSATFHVEEDFGAAWRKRNTRRRMGLGRALGTGTSLCLALAVGFVAMHYLPAYLSPSSVVRVSDLDEQALAERPEGLMGIVAPYWQSLQTRRSYMWSGDGVEVKYTRAAGESLELVVQRCARQIVVEVFNCTVEAQQVIRVDAVTGHHRLYLSEPGFYRFREQGGDGSRVIWRRV